MKLSLNKNVFKSNFVRNVFTLASGTIVAQGLTVIASPVLTRLFNPNDFGVLALFLSVSGIFSAIVNGKYNMSIVLPEKDSDAYNLFIISLFISIVISFCLFLIMVLFDNQLARLLDVSNSKLWLFWLIPIHIFIIGIYQSFEYWCIRKKDYKLISFTRINQSVFAICSQFCSKLLKMGALGLVGGQLFGRFVATLWIVQRTYRLDLINKKKYINISNMLNQAKKYKKYPMYSTWPALLDTFTIQMPVLFLAKFFGSSIVGYYALSMRVLQMPSSFIGKSVANVYFQKLSEESNDNNSISKIVEDTFFWLLVVGFIFGLCMLFSPVIFGCIFGEQWVVAGKYAQILAPAIALRFVVSPLTRVFGVCNRQELSAMWKVIAAIVTALTLAFSLLFNNPIYSLAFLCGNDLVLYFFYLYLIFNISNAHIISSLKRGWKTFKCVVLPELFH